MQEVQIDQMTEVELKALAFDISVDRDRAQNNLNAIFAELAKRREEPPVEKESKKKEKK